MSEGKYTFLIDTDGYAGNFERMLAWYITGVEPEYMHGGVEWVGKLADKELDNDLGKEVAELLDYRMIEHDGNGWLSYVEMPDGEINSVALYLAEVPSNVVLEHLRVRAKRFFELARKPPEGASKLMLGTASETNIKGFRLVLTTTKVETKIIGEFSP